ncbi:MAG: tetratricopeptide repeat protein [Cyanobacteria bacterium P01_D01_bin.1]
MSEADSPTDLYSNLDSSLDSTSELETSELEKNNRRALRRLILTAEANSQSLELLIAVCNDRNQQMEMIEAYEAELRGKGIAPFRVRLNPKQPSMRASIEELIEREPRLRSGEPAVVTVLNAEALLGVTLGEEQSEQEQFFFSLQWTREALLRFEFAVVLWVPDAVATKIGQRAPDFWSWRGGVFEFEAAVRQSDVSEPLTAIRIDNEEKGSALSIEALQEQIASLEESSPESSLLITSYNALGEAYEKKYAYDDALQQYQKSLRLAEEKKNIAGQMKALKNFGDSLRYSGRVAESVEYYRKSIEIAREISDRNGEANSLSGLGNSYSSLCQYHQAIDSYRKALEIDKGVGCRHGEASSLGNIGNVYDSIGEHERAGDFYLQALEIMREINNRNGEASSLCNLGNVYYSLNQPQQAIDFYQLALEIAREIGDLDGEARALCNLGNTRNLLCQSQQAIDLYRKALEIMREVSDYDGEARALGNIGLAYFSLGQYQKAIEIHQQALEIMHEIGDCNSEAASYLNKASALARLDQKWEAKAAYEEAKALFESLKLKEKVEDCEIAIRELGQKVVAVRRKSPEITFPKPRRRRIPKVVWLFAALFPVILIAWLFS